VKVILIDDEHLALELLEHKLLSISEVRADIIGKYVNPIAGKERIEQEDVDVVFLDIHLPEISGIELAEQLLELKPHLHIVFVTGYDAFAVKAFELNAIDYVVKPIRSERLAKTMQRLQERLSSAEAQEPDESLSIRLRVFHQVTVEQSEGSFAPLHWRTSKAQELFLYLLQHRGQLVRKSALIELLWPESEPNKVYPQLYTCVYHIRKTLEPFEGRFQISNTTEGYILYMNRVILDVDVWENQLQTLPPISKEALDRYAGLVQMYTGDYMQEYEYWWAEGERHRLRTLWLRCAFQLAEWYDQHHIREKAVEMYQSICSRHPQSEEAYFALMRIYAAMGNQPAVKRQYRLLADALHEELGEEPSAYVTKWYKDWKETEAVS